MDSEPEFGFVIVDLMVADAQGRRRPPTLERLKKQLKNLKDIVPPYSTIVAATFLPVSIDETSDETEPRLVIIINRNRPEK